MTFPQSKSSLETLSDCPYKFGQVYILGKKGADTKAAAVGKLVHKHLEVWRNTGVEPDKSETWETYKVDGIEKPYKVGEIAHAMMAELPPYGTPGITTEKDESFEINGLSYRAIKDWQSEEVLGDYKTTGSVTDKERVLTEETIRQDIQATLSARHMDRDLTLWWTYGQSKGKVKAKTVKLKVLRAEVNTQFLDVVEPLTVRALKILDKNDPESLSPQKNTKACFKYGKCHLYDECQGVSPGKAKYMANGNGSGLLAKLNELRADAATRVGAMVQDPVNPPVVREAPPPPAPEPAPELPKKPRGRPKKEATPTLTVVSDTIPAPAPEMEKDKPIRTLYCDCMPLTSKVVHAHELIAKAAEAVCDDWKVLNVKLIDFKSGACLSAQLEADIRAMEGEIDVALITRSPEGRDVYQTLMSLAQNIVVGL